MEELAFSVVEYLKSRYHEEAPHISVLSPDILAVLRFEKQQTILKAEEGEELELLESQLDPQRIRGNSTFGVRALFKDYSDRSQIEFRMCFFFRVAYPAEYRKAELSLRIGGFNSATIRMEVYNQSYSKTEEKRLVRECSISFPSGVLLVGFGISNIVDSALNTINELIYSGSGKIISLTEPAVLDALSTLPKNSAGHDFKIGIRPNDAVSSVDVRAVQNFVVEVAVVAHEGLAEVQLVFRYLCPSLIKNGAFVKTEGIPRFMYGAKPEVRNRWSLDRLLEVEGCLKWSNCRKGWSWCNESNRYAGLSGLTPIGCLAVEQDDALLLRDWHIAVEEVEGIEGSQRSIDDSFSQIAEKTAEHTGSASALLIKKVARAVLYALKEHSRTEGKQINYLYKFQEEALEEGLKALLSGEHRVIVLTTRTAGGKTLAFLLPLLIWIAYKRIAEGRHGVKALLFYPTKALANDQANLILKLVWHLNHQPEAPELLELKKPISLGILHGQSPYRRAGQHEQEEEVRLTCPLCGSRLVLVWSKKNGFYREEILCKNSKCALSRSGWMLEEVLKISREAIYSDPPDILIATPDIINARLTGIAMRMGVQEDPASLTIFGMNNYYCINCGTTFCGKKRKCSTCGATDVRKHESLSHPEAVVIDEGHLLRGAFGAQASHLITRLEQAVRTINGLDNAWRPVYFMSSATLSNPEDVACSLIASERSHVRVIRCKTSEHMSRTYRVHIFLMPKAYTPMATTSRALEALYSEEPSAVKLNPLLEELLSRRSSEFREASPGCIVFVNTLAEANELIGRLKSLIANARIDGHSTDYDPDKAMKEDMFTRGEIDILVATRGLEVGVDYSRARIGVIYGMPFFLSDYTQRIGRIGRNIPSIIIDVFMPDKPIDHFYYINWRLLCDNYLRSNHIQSTEAYLINRRNPEAVRRSGKRALIDYLSLKSGHLMEESLSKKRDEVEQLLDLKSVESYAYSALRLHKEEELSILRQSIEELLERVKQRVNESARLEQAIGGISSLTWLWNLRTAERDVEYRFPLPEPWGHRTKELSYAFRHCMPGQVISYREAFYVVDTVQAEPLYWEEAS